MNVLFKISILVALFSIGVYLTMDTTKLQAAFTTPSSKPPTKLSKNHPSLHSNQTSRFSPQLKKLNAIVTYVDEDSQLHHPHHVIALLESLRQTSTKAKIIVLHSKHNPPLELNAYKRKVVSSSSEFFSFQRVTPLWQLFPKQRNRIPSPYRGWDQSLAPLYAYSLETFHRILFIQANRIVLKNIDHLFDNDDLDDDASFIPRASRGICDPCDSPGNFSSGVFLLKPSFAKYEQLVSFAVQNSLLDVIGTEKVSNWEFPLDILHRSVYLFPHLAGEQQEEVNSVEKIRTLPQEYDYLSHSCLCSQPGKKKELDETSVYIANFGLCASNPWKVDYLKNEQVKPCFKSWVRKWHQFFYAGMKYNLTMVEERGQLYSLEKETKETEEPKETKKTKKTKEPKEIKESKEPKEPKEFNEPQETIGHKK